MGRIRRVCRLASGVANGGMTLLSFDYGFQGYGSLAFSLVSVLVVHTKAEEKENV